MNAMIRMSKSGLEVPSEPVIPYISGDGVGPELWGAAVRVFDAAVAKSFDGKRKVTWKKVLAGEEAFSHTGEFLPIETERTIHEHLVCIKGPLTTPVGGGIRSMNVALRQTMDLYAHVTRAQWFSGMPSPLRHPERINMITFREMTEDVYAGIEFQEGSADATEVKEYLRQQFPDHYSRMRFPDTSAIGIKPISEDASRRLVRAAIDYAVKNKRKSVTLVHKGNMMKFTEGAFREWGYSVAQQEFGATMKNSGPWVSFDNPVTGSEIIVKDVIADYFLQQILMRPEEYDVIAALNLNGDYISDISVACVGGMHIAHHANLNAESGRALFEVGHGTAQRYAGKDMVNPGSMILAGEMMFRYIGWVDAAERILAGMNAAIAARTVTYDLARAIDDSTLVGCSRFADEVIRHITNGH